MDIGTVGKIPETAGNIAIKIFTDIGLQADACALTAYDAVQIYGLA